MFRKVGSVYFPCIFHPFQTQSPTIHPPRVLLQRTTLEWLHVQLPEWSRSQPGSRFSQSMDLLPVCSTHQNAKFIKFHHVILMYLKLVGDLENWASNLINSESIIEISTPQWLKRNSSLHFDGTRIPNMCTNVGVFKLMYMQDTGSDESCHIQSVLQVTNREPLTSELIDWAVEATKPRPNPSNDPMLVAVTSVSPLQSFQLLNDAWSANLNKTGFEEIGQNDTVASHHNHNSARNSTVLYWQLGIHAHFSFASRSESCCCHPDKGPRTERVEWAGLTVCTSVCRVKEGKSDRGTVDQ